MLRVTVDTNIIVSGLNFPGNPRRILELAESGAIRLAVSTEILEEVADVLSREKFGWSRSEIAEATERLAHVAERVEPVEAVDLIKKDPSDNRILECAAAAKSDYLISGDKHLLSLERFGPTTIVKAADFLNVMQGR